MKLKCRINGKDYDIVQGATFSDEFNETLDSGTIIIDQVEKIDDLYPYDDVFIWDAKYDFNGYASGGTTEIIRNYFPSVTRQSQSIDGGTHIVHNFLWDSSLMELIEDKGFNNLSKEIVIDFTYKSVVRLLGNYETSVLTATYQITPVQNGFQLTPMSPTSVTCKAYLIGNISTNITRNLPTFNLVVESDNTISCIYYDDCFFRAGFLKMEFGYTEVVEPIQGNQGFYKHLLVDQYSEERLNLSDNLYKYKIELFSETKKLETIQLPNISITQPLKANYKISVYQYIKDFVSMYNINYKVATGNETWEFRKKYVIDDTNIQAKFGNVYAPDFTLNSPSLRDVLTQLMMTKDCIPVVKDDMITFYDISKDTGNFVISPSQMTGIIGSMSSDNYCNNLRRNYSNALSQDNSCRRVEYLGFRNSDNALLTIDNMRLETNYPIYKINKVYMCYYKKGIVNDSSTGTVKDVYFLCKQDISKLVKLESERRYLSQDWTDFGSTPPTNIDVMARYRMCTVGYNIGDNKITGFGEKYSFIPSGKWWTRTATYIENIAKALDSSDAYPYGIYSLGYITRKAVDGQGQVVEFANSFTKDTDTPNGDVVSPFSNDSLILKGLFFIVDYNAFYNGTVVHSKNSKRDDVTINDNSSASLTLLEQDGLFQKAKIERFGNKAIEIGALYESYEDGTEIQNVGSKYDNDVIIYSRTYQVYDTYIIASYLGTKNYVLKNYFTSVFAKYRTYNLMSYDESVNRADNKKVMVLLSKTKALWEYENKQLNFTSFGENALYKIFSAFNDGQEPKSIGYFEYPERINFGYIENKNASTAKVYVCDVNAFVSGYSLCFNMRMFDNVSMGTNFKTLEPTVDSSVTNDYKGTEQQWTVIADSSETGFIQTCGFYVMSLSDYSKLLFYDDTYVGDYRSNIINVQKDRVFKLPELDKSSFDGHQKNVIGNEFLVRKDNKETLDMTFQIEPITEDNNIMFSPLLMELSDLITLENKNAEDKTASDAIGVNFVGRFYSYACEEIKETITESNHYANNLVIFEIASTNVNSGLVGKLNTPVVLEWDKSLITFLDRGWWNNNICYLKWTIKEITAVGANTISFKIDQVAKVDGAMGGGVSTYTNNDMIYTFSQQQNISISHDASDQSDYVYYSNCNFVWAIQPPHYDLQGNIIADGFTYLGDLTTYIKVTKPDSSIMEFDHTQAGSNSLPYVEIKATYGSVAHANREFDMDDVPPKTDVVLFAANNEYVTETYAQNMFVYASEDNLNKNTVYNEYSAYASNANSVGNFVKLNKRVNETFSIVSLANGVLALRVDLSGVSSSYKTISYWFVKYDGIKYIYRFVFGVNITSEDITRGYVDIYLSLISTKDDRVFDEMHNIVGYVHNFANDNSKISGTSLQYYDIIEEEGDD